MHRMLLTKSQVRAVTHPGRNLQLLACAGSGKTEVLAHRVVHLLTPGHPQSLSPQNIAAFTFTEKAAAELRQRIITRTEQHLGHVETLSDLFVGTIHGFCRQLLVSEVEEFRGHTVINEVQQGLFINRHSKTSGLTTSKDLLNRQLHRYKDTARYAQAMSLFREMDCDTHGMQDVSVYEGLKAYMRLLSEHRYFDFSAVLEEAVETLSQNESVRTRLASRLKCIIVDEYQDVNPIQEKLVDLLHGLGAGVCVVGDDDQTIYQWRGSDVGNILNFAAKYPDVERIPLEENFRSSKGVVLTARAFIAQNSERLDKTMKSTNAQPYEKGDLAAIQFNDPREEAEYVAHKVRDLHGVAFCEQGIERGLSWSDMAVLLRSVKANAKPITAAFDRAGIPYVVIGMAELFSAAEAEAARQLFYFIARYTPPDELARTRQQIEDLWFHCRLGLKRDGIRAAMEDVIVSSHAIASEGVGTARWSEYSIQRVFFHFLNTAGLREEHIPSGRGELCLYNLGKFSQVISDFETINFKSPPGSKYQAFAEFLHYQAAKAYPEGWQDNRYANPDAVRIMTVHQAKGMQWPAVFLPALTRNRFPAAKLGGATVWHLVPHSAVQGHERLLGSTDDERRLFYVAMTRSQKFLHMTWAPVPNKPRYQKPSQFWKDVRRSRYVLKNRPDFSQRKRLPPKPRAVSSHVDLSLSDLKYFCECPYQFKMRVLYGFNPPLHEALGYGRSLRDALAEVYSQASQGHTPESPAIPDLIDRHLHVPYAYDELKKQLRKSAETHVRRYLDENGNALTRTSYSEQPVAFRLGDGVSVSGRVEVICDKGTGEVSLIDFKTASRQGREEITESQLRMSAAGFADSTGRRPDYIEVHDLESGVRTRQPVDDDMLAAVKSQAQNAAEALRLGILEPSPSEQKCGRCDFRGLCSAAHTARKDSPMEGLSHEPPCPSTEKPRPRSWFRKLFG